MRLAALAMALSCSVAWAEPPHSVDVRSAVVTRQDGSTVTVVEGCWLSTERCVGTAAELERLRAENARLRESSVPPAALVLTALVLGLAAGYGVARMVR